MNRGKGQSVVAVDLQPGEIDFNAPITIIHRWKDEDNDGWVDDILPIIRERRLFISKDHDVITSVCENNSCSCEDPPALCSACECSLYTNYFEIEVSSFSEYSLVAPLDSDEDDVPDDFDGVEDNCYDTPNGTALGLCAQTECGVYRYSLKECTDNTECVDHYGACWTCLQNQEDIYPPGGNDTGDACEWCYANFGGDSNVYPSDLSVFLGEYGRTDCITNPSCEADIDGDGNVYPSDLSIFLAEYGSTDCPTIP